MIEDWFVQFEPVAAPRRRVFALSPRRRRSVAPYRKWLPFLGERTTSARCSSPAPAVAFASRGSCAWPISSPRSSRRSSRCSICRSSSSVSVSARSWLSRRPSRCRVAPPRRATSWSRAAGRRSEGSAEITYTLSDEGFLGALRQSRVTPPTLLANERLVQMFLPALKRDAELHETYEYHSPRAVDMPVTALFGTNDTSVTRAEVEAWQHVTRRSCRVRESAGDHFFGHERAPQIASLALGRPRGRGPA